MTTPALPDPAVLVPTREALHRVAEQVLAPLRVQETGNEIALIPREDAVATPELPRGGWVGVAGDELVVAGPDGAQRRTALTTLRAAGRDAGLRAADDLDDETALAIDPAAARFLTATVFPLAAAALARLREEAVDPSETHLWPEHFDIAFDEGDEAAGHRAGYGLSPGDAEHPAPYAYVGPWSPPPEPGELWNATGFTGAQLDWAAIAAAPDPQAALLAFWRARRDALKAADLDSGAP